MHILKYLHAKIFYLERILGICNQFYKLVTNREILKYINMGLWYLEYVVELIFMNLNNIYLVSSSLISYNSLHQILYFFFQMQNYTDQ